MTPAPRERKRATINTTWSAESWGPGAVILDGGFVLPGEFRATADFDDQTKVEIDVHVVAERARATRVTVSTDQPNGIGWTNLATIPIRDIVAAAVLEVLKRVELQPKGMKVVKIRDDDMARVRQIVQSLVGYKPDPDRLAGKVTVEEVQS